MQQKICAVLAATAVAAGVGVMAAPVALADYVDQGCTVTTPKTTGRYTVNDLKGVRAFWLEESDSNTLHYISGFDHTKVGPYRMPSGSNYHAGVRDQPSGWGVEGCASSDGTDHWTLVAPDGTKVITYIIGTPEEHVDQNGVRAIVNGVPWSGWNESTTSYDLRAQYPNGAKLSFTNLPAGVTVQSINGTYNGAPTTLVRFVQNGVVSKDYNFLGATYDPNGGTTNQPSTPSNPNGTGKPSQPSTPSEPQPEEGMQHVYRLYDGRSGRHFWTASVNERDALVRGGWRYEGVGFDMPVSGNPVYRAYNPRSGDHMWTLSAREYQVVTSNGWRAEGIGFYANDGANPVYRLYNGRSGDHMWTKSANERDVLVRGGWRYEGVAWTTKN